MVVRTESLPIPNWHDTGSTSPRSGSEVALIWDTISHYSPVLIAPLAIDFNSGLVGVSHAKEELRERFDAHAERGRNRGTLGVERINQATDTGCDAVIVVVVVTAGRLHAADIE